MRPVSRYYFRRRWQICDYVARARLSLVRFDHGSVYYGREKRIAFRCFSKYFPSYARNVVPKVRKRADEYGREFNNEIATVSLKNIFRRDNFPFFFSRFQLSFPRRLIVPKLENISLLKNRKKKIPESLPVFEILFDIYRG